MKAVILRSQAEVGAVVHDELDARSEPRPKFTRLLEHLPGVPRLVAVLQQGAAGSSEFLGGGEHSGNVGKTRSVENRVESWKLQHRLNCRDAACRVSALLRS